MITMGRQGGPATSGVAGRRANRLNYDPASSNSVPEIGRSHSPSAHECKSLAPPCFTAANVEGER